MAGEPYIGTWEIETCWIPGIYGADTGLEGTKFCLDDAGDVTWWPKRDDVADIPLFACETYEIYSTTIHGAILRFGAYAEHIIEFRAQPAQPRDGLDLTCDGWCVLHCVRARMEEPECRLVETFTLLPAVEDGYFSDMVIEAEDNKQFHVHSSILGLLGKDMAWLREPPPLSGLPEPVVGSVLHWLYAECLPGAMTEQLAQQVLAAVEEFPCLARLAHACKLYLRNMALKQEIVELVSDMHACATQIIEYFSAPGECLGCHPAKLCLVVKQSLREAGVAIVKLLVLLELFSKRKGELLREERHEIIRYARSRLPVFMSQLRRLLEALQATFSSTTPAQRLEIATYLVPEVEAILDTVLALLFEVKAALELLQTLSRINMGVDSEEPSPTGSPMSVDALGGSLRNVLKKREFAKLNNFLQKLTFSFMHLVHKKGSFAEMSDGNKIRSVSRNLEQLVEELPIFLLRLEEVTSAMDERLQWREFKFCFKVATSKVSGILAKLTSHGEVVHNVTVRLCSLVQREAFTLGVISLGLLSPDTQLPGATQQEGEQNPAQTSRPHPPQHGFKLSLVETLMKPPPTASSQLAKAAGKLLKSERFADMVFEITCQQTTHTGSKSPTDNSLTNPSNLEKTNNGSQASSSKGSAGGGILPPEGHTTEENGSVIMKAHRVIVATRCDWFRRALQSGMKEAIHRRIVIHDTTPGLFRKLLSYLYTGRLDTRSANAEQLTELVLLGDRYELDALKQACEKTLATKHLDKDSSFYYLGLADQYNASFLRESCVKFIATRIHFLESDMFAELPSPLQAEVYAAAAAWPPRSSRGRSRSTKPDKHPLTDAMHRFKLDDASPWPVLGRSQSVDQVLHKKPSMETLLPETSGDEGSNSDCSSVEDISIDRARLNDCLARLRDVLGPQVSQEDLNRIALAADYDANRAVNFYYTSYTFPEDS